MRVLTPDNTTFDIDDLPEVVSDDVRYCVLDYSDPDDVDFYFIPLFFLDTATKPSATLKIGKYRIQMPLDWSVVIADKHQGTLEIIALQQLNDRDFDVFCFNPVNGYSPHFLEINIEDVFSEVTWTIPKLRNGHLLAVPLNNDPNPLCALFVREVNKLPDILDIASIFS